jgi:hypothetical protein
MENDSTQLTLDKAGTNVRLTANVKVTTTPVASSGPLFLTVMV